MLAAWEEGDPGEGVGSGEPLTCTPEPQRTVCLHREEPPAPLSPLTGERQYCGSLLGCG